MHVFSQERKGKYGRNVRETTRFFPGFGYRSYFFSSRKLVPLPAENRLNGMMITVREMRNVIPFIKINQSPNTTFWIRGPGLRGQHVCNSRGAPHGHPASSGEQGRRLRAKPPAVPAALSRARHQSQWLWANRQHRENHVEFLFPFGSPGSLEPHTYPAPAATAGPQTCSQQT